MDLRPLFGLVLYAATGAASAAATAPVDLAAACGARPGAADMVLSPGRSSVACVGPAAGQRAVVYTLSPSCASRSAC